MNTSEPKDGLLKQDALKNVRIAISASESPDLVRLGLVETHFRLALAEIARSVLVSGGKLAYGGHLDPLGYTVMLVKELHRYSSRDKPLRIYLAWQEHLKLSREQYELQKDQLGLFGEIVCLDPDGNEIDWGKNRGDEPIVVGDPKLRQQSLTAMRVRMARTENGRILIGGRRAGFQGAMPGVLEEASLSLASGQPLYVAGGFGGACADIAHALGLDGGSWLPTNPDAPPPDIRLTAGLRQLTQLATKTGWKATNNGLSDDENSHLAATYRPSEIAALVSLGLGRRFAQSAGAEGQRSDIVHPTDKQTSSRPADKPKPRKALKKGKTPKKATAKKKKAPKKVAAKAAKKKKIAKKTKAAKKTKVSKRGAYA